jgi:hypothetical protein
MKFFSNVTFAVVLTGLLLCPASGQQNQTESPLALEVRFEKGPPSYMAVAPAGSKPRGSVFSRFGHILSWKAPDNTPPVTAVRIVPVAEGKGARVTVSVLFGESRDKEEIVGGYLVNENQKVSTPELIGFGIAPFDLKVVAPTGVPSPGLPLVNNNTTSIETVGVKPDRSLLATFIVTLRNNAPKRVVALEIRIVTARSSRIPTHLQGIEGNGLIEPGATYAFRAEGGDQSTVPASTDGMPAVPTAITINTVIFDDGSYEGDPKPAADFLSVQAGYWVQLKRVGVLLDANSGSPGADLRALKSKVLRLVETPSREELSAIPAKYVFPDDNVQFDAISDFKFGARRIKQLLLEDIGAFEKVHAAQESTGHAGTNAATADDARAWVKKASEKYSGWLSRM